MIRRLWHLLFGIVVVKVKGARLERFLNRIVRAHIPVWQAERLAGNMLIVSMPASRFKQMRHLCRQQGWHVSVVERLGFPFFVARLIRRKALVAGAVMALIALYVASGHVWFVQVSPTVDVSTTRILAVAEQAGLRPGVRKESFDPKEVQRTLLLQLDELSWVGVSVRGTLAVIEVAERSQLDPQLTRPGDIVAARDGIIHRITVSQGYPLVAVGDTVRRGDLVISGFIPPDDPRHRQMLDEGKPPYVRADGVVTARVWYEGQSRVRLVATEAQPTGRGGWRVELSVGGWEFGLGPGQRGFDAFEGERRSWETSLLGKTLALAWTRVKEVRFEQELLSEEEARDWAVDAALADLEARLPDDVEVVDGPYVEVAFIEGEFGKTAVATARAEVVEAIRSFRPYP